MAHEGWSVSPIQSRYLVPSCAPPEWRLATFVPSQSLDVRTSWRYFSTLCKFNLENKSKTSQHLGVTEWRARRDARRQPWNCPYELHSCCPIYVTQRTPVSWHLPRERLMGCLNGSMMSQVLGGVNLPSSWYCVRGQPPSTGGQDHTHTLTKTIFLGVTCGWVAEWCLK